jgi:hypothetical protein
LAWRLVQQSDEATRISGPQQKRLASELQKLTNELPGSVQGAWCVLVAADESGAIKAERLKALAGNPNATPFERIVAMLRESERLAPERIDPELLLPDSYLTLWHPGQTSLPVQTLVNSFGQFTRLPRILRRTVLEESLRQGTLAGTFVLRWVRSDGSMRTFWRQAPSDEDLRREELEIVPLANAILTSLDPHLLRPGTLPDLWTTPPDSLPFSQFSTYFDGRGAPCLESREVLAQALRTAIKEELLMAQLGSDAWSHESLPPDLSLDEVMFSPPPPALSAGQLGALNLPHAWNEGHTTVGQLGEALTAKLRSAVPWPALRDALVEGNRQGLFSVDTSLLLVASSVERAAIPIRPRQITSLDTSAFIEVSIASSFQGGQPKLRDIKAAMERGRGVTIPDEVFLRAAKQAASEGKISLPEQAKNLSGSTFLDLRVQPKKIRVAGEARLNLKALSDIAQKVKEVMGVAPELTFEFQITISAEGEALSPEQLKQMNEILSSITPNLRLT